MNTNARHSFEKRYVWSLRRWRWLILLVVFLSVVVLEAFEHGLSLTDMDFLREVAAYGLLAPSLTWIVFTVLARRLEYRANHRAQFDLYRQLTLNLDQHQEWDDLTRYIAEFPSAFLPVDQIALFIYDHRTARPRLVGAWGSTPNAVTPAHFDACYDMCRAWLLGQNGMRRAPARQLPSNAADGRPAEEFCLPLGYRGVLVGLLWLRCLPGRTLAPDQINFMDGIASRVALALVLSIAWPQQMAQARAEAQADERQRIAYELHNSLAQDISYLHLGLDRLSRQAELVKDAALQQEVERMRDVANDAYVQIRDDVSLLRVWQHTDLAQVISDYARTVAQRTEMDIDLRADGILTPLAPETCQRIFSFVKEGLRNVEKHAHARQAHIRLGWSADELSIDLVDDGIGFDPSAVPDGHFGLAMMREWADRLGGTFEADSAPGRGTRLSIAIPLTEAHTTFREESPARLHRESAGQLADAAPLLDPSRASLVSKIT